MQHPQPPPWASLSQEEHEFQYNPQRAFPTFADHQMARVPLNAAARASLNAHLDLPYGDHPLRRVDIYPAAGAAAPAPVHVFFHGGYWRAQDKENFAFLAAPFVARGVTTVIANYELCPGSTLDGVVDSAIAAVEWTFHNITEYGGDSMRIGLSGHSAGAHLCAEILAVDWRERDIDPSFIRRRGSDQRDLQSGTGNPNDGECAAQPNAGDGGEARCRAAASAVAVPNMDLRRWARAVALDRFIVPILAPPATA